MKFFLKPCSPNPVNPQRLPPVVLEELEKTVSQKKGEIDEFQDEWERVKRYIHPYEYIYSSSFTRNNISKIKPVSRSYFKMVEILSVYGIRVDQKDILCLAEAPGGFIQRLLEFPVNRVHGITLISEDRKVPYWNHTILKDKRFTEHRGNSEDGDLISLSNILGFAKEIGSVSIVTGDGGFDVSDDYDAQERMSYPLIFSEIFLSLLVLEPGGVFTCKIFDTFRRETLCLLSLLHRGFDQIVMHKPCMSRMSNSEKYIVCLGYRGKTTEITNTLARYFLQNEFDIDVSDMYVSEMIEFIKRCSTSQMDLIEVGIQQIKEKKYMRGATKLQIRKAREWCVAHGIEINTECIYLRDS
jgi:23S rRNA U2552 (ribose-2'-O)-methylase RlmE/FtsJ